jgi:hypothetical protein
MLWKHADGKQKRDDDVETEYGKTMMTGKPGCRDTKEETTAQVTKKSYPKRRKKICKGRCSFSINSTRDPNLLKRMYVGWASWI